MLTYPKDFYKKIEFDKIIEILSGFAISSLTRDYFSQLMPSDDKDWIKLQLARVGEMNSIYSRGESFPMRPYEPVEYDVALLRKEGYVLEVESIQKLYQLTKGASEIVAFFNEENQGVFPKLYELVRDIPIHPELIKHIDTILDDEGLVKPNASERLLKISRQIHSKEREIDKVFSQEMAFFQAKGFLADTKESLRNGRRVFAVSSEHKRKIEGLIHDESATGKTAFIEPTSLVSLNNEVFNLYTERKKEIYKILKELCTYLRPFSDTFIVYEKLHFEFDKILCKKKLGSLINARIPKISKKRQFKFVEARNPILLIKHDEKGLDTIPFDLELYGKNRIVILSGPNAGGKSVVMKSVGLLQTMVQCGLPVSVSELSEFGIFEKFFADIGDQQSIDDDLSTYSSHLKNMKVMTDEADHKSLVLIDEFGAGTDPKIGGAIAEALLKELNAHKCHAVITTHYSGLKFFAYNTSGLVNACMEFDRINLSPTFQLVVGKPGSSFAFEIAQKTGFDESILDYAKSKTGKQELQLDEILVKLQAERQELEMQMSKVIEEKDKLDVLIKSYEVMHREMDYAKNQLKLDRQQMLLDLANKKKEQTKLLEQKFHALRNMAELNELKKSMANEEKKIASEINHIKQNIHDDDKKRGAVNLEVGQYVKLRNGGTVAKLLQLEKDKAELELGNIKMWIPIVEILPSEKKEDKHQGNTSSIKSNIVLDDHFDSTLDLRGYSVQEAEDFLHEFIDGALINNAFELKVIHGVGSGALKKLVKKIAKEYKSVKKIWHPEPDQGGDGVTYLSL